LTAGEAQLESKSDSAKVRIVSYSIEQSIIDDKNIESIDSIEYEVQHYK